MVVFFSDEQLAEMQAIFDELDKDQSTNVTKSEFSKALKINGEVVSDEDMEFLMECVQPNEVEGGEDEDEDVEREVETSVDFEGFVILMALCVLLSAFLATDTDGSGLLSKEDIHTAMRSIGKTFTDEEIDEYIASVDEDGDGMINIKEFAKSIVSS